MTATPRPFQKKEVIFLLAGQKVTTATQADWIYRMDLVKHGPDFYRLPQAVSVAAQLRAAGQY